MADQFVQAASSSVPNNPVAGQFQVTFGSPVTSGNTVVVFVGTDANVTPTVSDNQGNSYTLIATKPDGPNGEFMWSFRKENVTNGPTVVTADFGGGTSISNGAMCAAEGNAGTLDNHSENLQASPTTSADATTTGAVTVAANAWVVAAVMDTGAFRAANQYTAGTGFTERAETGSGSAIDMCLITRQSSGSQAGLFTSANNDACISMMASFNPLSAPVASIVRDPIHHRAFPYAPSSPRGRM